MKEFTENDWEGFYILMQMYPNFFHDLKLRLTPRLQKTNTNWREAASVGLKMGMMLHYMTTGCNLTNIHHSLWD